MSALVVAYHAIEAGPAPLCLDPASFREHVDAVRAARATVLTVGELADALRAGALPERAVCFTFDDGCASVVGEAAPVLAAAGYAATVFCVAEHLDGYNDWPTQPRSAPRLRLASSAALAELASLGWEIGAHGFRHAPLVRASRELAELEVVEAKRLLEQATGARVRSFALPYDARPSEDAARLLAESYDAVCGGGLRRVEAGDSPLAIPRVDAHYLRSPARLRAAIDGRLDVYLAARRLGARARRLGRAGWVA